MEEGKSRKMQEPRLREDRCVEFFRFSRRNVVIGLEVDDNGTIINWPPYAWRLGGKQIRPVINGMKKDGWKVEQLEVR